MPIKFLVANTHKKGNLPCLRIVTLSMSSFTSNPAIYLTPKIKGYESVMSERAVVKCFCPKSHFPWLQLAGEVRRVNQTSCWKSIFHQRVPPCLIQGHRAPEWVPCQWEKCHNGPWSIAFAADPFWLWTILASMVLIILWLLGTC